MSEIFALIDCNNFYASCERSFNPKLIGIPVVILSNNDGCIIARSNEAKALGIPMGIAMHKSKKIFEQNNVVVLSSNFALYGEMSNRIMKTLKTFCPEQEVYSIDESFLRLSSLHIEDYKKYGTEIVETIKRSLGIPVSIGIAHSKTLAKLGNKIAKKNYEQIQGVKIFMQEEDINNHLKNIAVNEIWGIGSQITAFLNSQGIYTGLDFKDALPSWIRSNLGITGSKTQSELFGKSCLKIEDIPQPKKGILSSRSFRNPVSQLEDLEEAVSTYIARAAEKLREESSLASIVGVSIVTNRHKIELPQYYNSMSITLPYATNYNPILIENALKSLRTIFKSGYYYKKASVYLSSLVPENNYQYSLYETNTEKKVSLMKAIDRINYKMGGDTAFYASQGTVQPWRMKQENTSPNYILKWDELPAVK